MNNESLIRAEHLSIDYQLGKRWLNVIRDVSLTIYPSEVHGLVGESGSGKSTLALALMRYMAGNARISNGEIWFAGENLLTKSQREMRHIWGKQIALVPQNPLASLNPAYTIGEQIAEITRQHLKLTRKDAWEHAVEMLSRVKIADPATIAKRYPHQLSGGMQQRVTIAMALSTQPRLLILDEPTTSLDVTTEATILDLFQELIQDNDAAALYVTHDLGVVAEMCDTVTVLYAGEIMASGPVKALYKAPLHPYTISLLASLPRPTEGTETRLPTIEGTAPSLAERPPACVFSDRCPLAIEICHTEKPPLEQAADGRWVKCHRWQEIAAGEVTVLTAALQAAESAPPQSGWALQVQDIDKSYDEPSMFDRLTRKKTSAVHAVDHVSININRRSTLGLVGESGSGKTSLARCIVGLNEADGGDLMLLERPIALDLANRPREVLRDLQMVFQNPHDSLNPYHTVGQTLARTLYRLSDEHLSKEQSRVRVVELLEAVRLTAAYADRYPNELSGGEKQRVAIARAFATSPALVVADEPVSSLDVSVKAVILNLLKDLRAQEGASYLLISHDLSVVAYLADWIVVMYLGQIVEEGDPQQVYNAPSHPYTEALLSAMPNTDPNATNKRIRLEGDLPSARNIPSGCRFHTRCPRKIGAVCEQEEPPNRDAGNGHLIRCHIPIDELIALQSGSLPERQP